MIEYFFTVGFITRIVRSYYLTKIWLNAGIPSWYLIGRAVPLPKPRPSPHHYARVDDHAENFPPPMATLQALSYHVYLATQTLLFSSPLILAIRFRKDYHIEKSITLLVRIKNIWRMSRPVPAYYTFLPEARFGLQVLLLPASACPSVCQSGAWLWLRVITQDLIHD